MKRDFLKQLELTDEQIEKVMSEYGKSVDDLKSKAEKADELNTKIDDLNTQLSERDKQLEDLGSKAKGNDELTQQIDELRKQNEETQKEYEQRLEKQAFDHTLEKKLTSEKVRNPKAVKALLDMDTLKLDGEELKGLNEQITTLKESDPYLFEQEQTEEPQKPSYSTGEHKTPDANNDPFVSALGIKK